MTPGDRQDDPGTDGEELPADVIEEAERLTHLAREAVDDDERAAYRDHREELLDDHGFTARVRHEETQEVLVLYPAEWVHEGSVHPERIDDLDRAVEVTLSGTGDPEDWDAVDEHNRDLARQVREAHGEVHGDNAAAFADFMSNHYAKRIEEAASTEVREFVDEYFPRNAWPTAQQQAVVGRSIELTFEAAGEQSPDV